MKAQSIWSIVGKHFMRQAKEGRQLEEQQDVEPAKLLWEEDFSDAGSTRLSEKDWSFHTGNGSEFGIPGWGNDELQVYRKENAEVQAGQLKLTAASKDGHYYSAKVHTKGKRDFYPGQSPNGIRVEATIKLPKGGQGVWPAFWMLPSEGPNSKSGEGVYGHWPMSGEIDIMEAINHMDTTSAAIHFGGPGQHHRQISASTTGHLKTDKGFHVYAVEWRAHSMTFLVDGKPYLRSVCSCKKGQNGWYTSNGAKNATCSGCAPFDRPFHIILNVAVGGVWPGNPNVFTTFPQTMIVKNVKVWGL